MQALLSKPMNILGRYETSTILSSYKPLFGLYTEQGENSTVFYHSGQLSAGALNIWKKLNSFKALKDNWDSYGADVPSASAIEKAVDFVREADRLGLPLYFAAPGVNGEVMVEFKGKGNKAAEIYFNPDGSTELLLFSGDDSTLEGTLEEHQDALISFFNN